MPLQAQHQKLEQLQEQDHQWLAWEGEIYFIRTSILKENNIYESMEPYHKPSNCVNLQSDRHFECIIYSPLGSSKSSNHNNTEGKTTGKETPQAKLLHRLHYTVYKIKEARQKQMQYETIILNMHQV